MNQTKENKTISRLYEKWENLKNQAKNDCSPIDKYKPDNNFNLSELYIKWLNYQQDWQRVFLSIESKRKQMYRELIHYYRMDYDMRLDTKDELNLFIETDDRYVLLLEQSKIIKMIILYRCY